MTIAADFAANSRLAKPQPIAHVTIQKLGRFDPNVIRKSAHIVVAAATGTTYSGVGNLWMKVPRMPGFGGLAATSREPGAVGKSVAD